MRSVLFAAPLIASQAYGYSTCGASQYKTVITETFLGMQTDPTNTASDCYDKATVFANKVESLFNSVVTISAADWLAPVYVAAETTVTATDVFTYCETTQFAKQLATRTNSLPGLFDFISTIGVAVVKEQIATGTSDLYNAFMDVQNAADCATQSVAIGQSVSKIFSYEIPNEYLADQLNESIIGDVFE